MLPSGTQAQFTIPYHPKPQPLGSSPVLPYPAAGLQPSSLIPDTVKAQPTGRLEAECFLQVGTAIMVNDLPEM